MAKLVLSVAGLFIFLAGLFLVAGTGFISLRQLDCVVGVFGRVLAVRPVCAVGLVSLSGARITNRGEFGLWGGNP